MSADAARKSACATVVSADTRILVRSLFSVRSSIANDLEHGLLYLVYRQAAGVQVDGVGRLYQRRLEAGAVASIALGDLAGDGFARQVDFARTPIGADVRAGVQEDLHRGAREYHGSDVTTLDHARCRRPGLALFLDQRPADGGDLSDFRRSVGDLGGADGLRHVLAVQQYGGSARDEFDAGFAGELFEPMHVGDGDIRAQGPQRDGAVHGAGVDVQVSELVGDAAGERALAGAGRAVDGYCDALAVQ